MKRRVVVSGVGAVSGYGAGAELLWNGLVSGETAVRPVSWAGWESAPVQVAQPLARAASIDTSRASATPMPRSMRSVWSRPSIRPPRSSGTPAHSAASKRALLTCAEAIGRS